jgi:hypothetical protein
MKTFLTLVLSLLVSQLSFGATAQVNSVSTPGSIIGTASTYAPPSPLVIPSSDAPNWHTLTAFGPAVGAYGALFDMGNTTGTQYVLPTGHSMEVHQICISDSVQANGDSANMGFATATFTDQTTTDPTGVKYFSGGKTVPNFKVNATPAGGWQCFNDIFTFTNASGGNYYPFMYNTGGGILTYRVIFKYL